jgi:hypothetical protein
MLTILFALTGSAFSQQALLYESAPPDCGQVKTCVAIMNKTGRSLTLAGYPEGMAVPKIEQYLWTIVDVPVFKASPKFPEELNSHGEALKAVDCTVTYSLRVVTNLESGPQTVATFTCL